MYQYGPTMAASPWSLLASTGESITKDWVASDDLNDRLKSEPKTITLLPFRCMTLGTLGKTKVAHLAKDMAGQVLRHATAPLLWIISFGKLEKWPVPRCGLGPAFHWNCSIGVWTRAAQFKASGIVEAAAGVSSCQADQAVVKPLAPTWQSTTHVCVFQELRAQFLRRHCTKCASCVRT